MAFGHPSSDERALSSVLGVVLLIAITIVLAAVVGTFVLGIGDQLTSESPQTNLEFSFTNDSVTILHGGGDELMSENINVEVNEEDVSISGSGWDRDPITVGDSMTIEEDDISGDIEPGDRVIVIWTSDDGQRAAILGEETVP